MNRKEISQCNWSLALAIVMAATLAASTIAPAIAQPGGKEIDSRPAVGLVLLDNLMSGRSQVGDRVHFETVAPVYDQSNNLLIPAGSSANGRVTRSKGSGMFGKRGQLDFTCDYIIMPDGSHVPLVGKKVGGAGTNDTAETAAVTVLVSPVGLLIKGGTLKIDSGTPIKMFIADGAVITPVAGNPPELRADFTSSDKHTPDIDGTVTGFDGDAYTVHAGGGDQRLSLDQISSISVDGPSSHR